MDFDICLVCHSRIDYSQLEAAYPHLTEASDFLPPEGMSLLEENIYWGNICLACARLVEADAPETARPQQSSPAVLPQAGPGPFPGPVHSPVL